MGKLVRFYSLRKTADFFSQSETSTNVLIRSGTLYEGFVHADRTADEVP